MATSATIEGAQLRIEPGGSAESPLEIRNDSEIVENYRFQVVGVPAAWTKVDPEQVTLYPGTSAQATLVFSPPRDPSAVAGLHPFAVHIVPQERPDQAVAPESVIEVLPFLATSSDLTPKNSIGRRRGRHDLAIVNRGNMPISVALDSSDPSEALTISTHPGFANVEAGVTSFSAVRVRANQRLWRGQPKTHPFSVLTVPDVGPQLVVDGTYVQEPLVPRWLPKAIAALIALAAVLALLWFQLFKPQMKDIADAEGNKILHSLQPTPPPSRNTNGGSGGKVTPTPTPPARTAPHQDNASVGAPYSTRLSLQASAHHSATSTSPRVAAGKRFDLTDIVMENPQGDFGTMTILAGDPTACANRDARCQTLFNVSLENFRDDDYHFVSPIRLTSGQAVVVVVQCNGPGNPPKQIPQPTTCNDAVYLGGDLTKS